MATFSTFPPEVFRFVYFNELSALNQISCLYFRCRALSQNSVAARRIALTLYQRSTDVSTYGTRAGCDPWHLII